MTQVRPARSQPLQRILNDIRELGLNDNLIELETLGYTTVPGILSEQTIARARNAILTRVEATTGDRIDPATATADDFEGMTYLPYLLYDDEVFEEILMEPKSLALITYLLGESCLLSSLGCHFKGPGGTPLALHSDNGNGMPAPFSATAQVANVNYALTPYSEETGALAILPSSHQLGRQPRPDEMVLGGEKTNPNAMVMERSPGDMVVWHGNTWHGSFARQIPGIRMNLAVYCNRQYIQTQEQRSDGIPQDVARRQANNEQFNILLGAKQPYGWRHEGPDYSLMARNPRGRYD